MHQIWKCKVLVFLPYHVWAIRSTARSMHLFNPFPLKAIPVVSHKVTPPPCHFEGSLRQRGALLLLYITLTLDKRESGVCTMLVQVPLNPLPCAILLMCRSGSKLCWDMRFQPNQSWRPVQDCWQLHLTARFTSIFQIAFDRIRVCTYCRVTLLFHTSVQHNYDIHCILMQGQHIYLMYGCYPAIKLNPTNNDSSKSFLDAKNSKCGYQSSF